MKADTILFDLDGTITDSAPGILASVRYALSHVTSRAYSDAELRFFIGPPLLDSFMKLLSCSPDESKELLGWYREFYTGSRPGLSELPGLLMNSVYDGVRETLQSLKADGYGICLATAKPETFARRILEHFGLTGLFDAIHGATLDESRNRKAQVVAWALSHSGDVGRAVMVGDRADDAKGAAANGIGVIGALWGYGSEEELREAGATVFCKTIHELPQLLKEN